MKSELTYSTKAGVEFDTTDITPFLPTRDSTENSLADDTCNKHLAGGILFGYDLGIISGAILQLRQEFCLGIVRNEVVVSSLVGGAVFGSLTGGILVDFLGRKVSIILDSAIFCVGAVVLVVSEGFWPLVLGRLIIGYGVSLSVTAECVYVSEIAPASKRGLLVSLNELGVCVGILLAYFINYLFIDVSEGWRYMFGLSIIVAVIQGVGTLFLPRTPCYLLLKGKDELALNTLQKIRGRGTDVASEFSEIRAAILEGKRHRWWDLFRLKDCMLYRLLIGCMVVLFQQLSGQNSLLYYTPTLLKLLGFSSNQAATLATIGIGRRPLLLIGISIMAVCMFLLGSLSVALVDPHLVSTDNPTMHLFNCTNLTLFSSAEYTFPTNLTLSTSDQTSITATKWLSLILLMVYVGAYEISFGSIAWLLLTEMFPPSVRGQAFSLATVVNWLMNFIVSVSLLSVYHLLLGYMYIMYGVFCVVALICVFFMVPETKGKSLERISEELKNKISLKICYK